MKADDIKTLDAALEMFMRYGFKRATMGDIAQAAGLSRQSLYARFANKDEVYAAVLDLYGTRIIAQLQSQWATSSDLGDAMDAFAAISVIPTFTMLRHSPDASDMIEAANSPEGQDAMARVTALKCAALSALFAPYSDALAQRGLTPDQLADFVESNKHAMTKSTQDRAHLDLQIATLKASVLSLTS